MKEIDGPPRVVEGEVCPPRPVEKKTRVWPWCVAISVGLYGMGAGCAPHEPPPVRPTITIPHHEYPRLRALGHQLGDLLSDEMTHLSTKIHTSNEDDD